MPANIKFERLELKAIKPVYTMVADCLAGEKRVKFKGETYLPKPNAEDVSEYNDARYKAYLKRAVFYNVTNRTIQGYLGQLFLKEPDIETPEQMKLILEDANGAGVSIVQLAKKASKNVIAFGREGLFVDYPRTNGGATIAEIEAGEIRPTLHIYNPNKIINWHTKNVGAKNVLSIVVILEEFETSPDGFEIEIKSRYKVLRLGLTNKDEIFNGIVDDDNVFTVEHWAENAEGTFNLIDISQPKGAGGENLNEIPFTFIGAENNDSEIDEVPAYDLASLNIAHYRNSADYEEACYIVGQPTPYISGLSEHWVTTVLKDTMTLGSRGVIPLPEGGSAGLLQAEPNIMPFEAMTHKEKQMVAIGAKLAEQSQVQQTATEVSLANVSENSILSSIALNVSEAFEFGLKWAAFYMGLDNSNIKFKVNSDFNISKMTSQERQALIAEWQSGAITFEEMRKTMRHSGMTLELDDEAARTEMENSIKNDYTPEGSANV